VTHRNAILLTPFLGQTAFVAVLAAVLVNLRKPWRRNRKPPPVEKTETRKRE
jgi:hypothetical protein